MDPLEEAWAQVVANWEDDAAHKRFVALCAAHERLAVAGQKYRSVRDADPDRAEVAQQRIESLIALATQQMQMDHEEPPVATYKRYLLIAAAAIMVVLIGTAVLLLRASS